MSLKPPKKSDLGKSWMKNRRDKARMIQPEYHLIASEGTETEPQYFGAIQRIINSKYRDRIQLKVEGIGDNTVKVRRGVKHRDDSRAVILDDNPVGDSRTDASAEAEEGESLFF